MKWLSAAQPVPAVRPGRSVQVITAMPTIVCRRGELFPAHGTRVTKKPQLDPHSDKRERSYKKAVFYKRRRGNAQLRFKILDRIPDHEETHGDTNHREAG